MNDTQAELFDLYADLPRRSHTPSFNLESLAPAAHAAGTEWFYIRDGSEQILVAGRTVSSDRAAHAGMREQPFCMAMGQAAGAAAALATQQGIASRDVDLEQLRALLKQHGAIVPEKG